MRQKESRGEMKIREILEKAGISFEQEFQAPRLVGSTGIPLRFDFAIFDDSGQLDAFIEFQGRQHYEAVSVYGGVAKLKKQRRNDERKRRYCAIHGIHLIEIPYIDEHIMDYDYIIEKLNW